MHEPPRETAQTVAGLGKQFQALGREFLNKNRAAMAILPDPTEALEARIYELEKLVHRITVRPEDQAKRKKGGVL